jgi:hypothetical protein
MMMLDLVGDFKWFFRAVFWFLNGFLRIDILSTDPDCARQRRSFLA